MTDFNSKLGATKIDELERSTLWRKIKRDAKKDDSRFRREGVRTGGVPDPEPTSATTEEVKAMLPAVFKPVSSVLDDSNMDAAADVSVEEPDAFSIHPPRQTYQVKPAPFLSRFSPHSRSATESGRGEKITDFASEYHRSTVIELN